MLKRIGFIGAGHITEYLVTGLRRSNKELVFSLADPDSDRAAELSSRFGGYAATNNQDAVNRSELIILATRPDAVETALSGIEFRPEQIVVSVAAGVLLKTLKPMTIPAETVRVLPVSCVAINKSPILLYPQNSHVYDLFSLVGQVHVLQSEDVFSPATSLVGAFYAWIFALMDEAASWTASEGIDPGMARNLVIETIEGACGMAREQATMSLKDIWNTLATPGGISEYGIRFLTEPGCIEAWSKALRAVTDMIDNEKIEKK